MKFIKSVKLVGMCILYRYVTISVGKTVHWENLHWEYRPLGTFFIGNTGYWEKDALGNLDWEKRPPIVRPLAKLLIGVQPSEAWLVELRNFDRRQL